MAHNEDNDHDDYDDQHVHLWQPNNPPQIPLSFRSTKLVTSNQAQCLGDGKIASP